jgi:Leucyl-tRNA synthetase, Domain 2
VATGAVATNPATGASIPVFVADYVLMGYGTGAIMGVPGQDERDCEFAEAFDLPIIRTVQPPEGFEGRAYTGGGPAINSGLLDGLDVAAAKQAIIGWLNEHDAGEPAVTYKLRDWLFSRQRYWVSRSRSSTTRTVIRGSCRPTNFPWSCLICPTSGRRRWIPMTRPRSRCHRSREPETGSPLSSTWVRARDGTGGS